LNEASQRFSPCFKNLLMRSESGLVKKQGNQLRTCQFQIAICGLKAASGRGEPKRRRVTAVHSAFESIQARCNAALTDAVLDHPVVRLVYPPPVRSRPTPSANEWTGWKARPTPSGRSRDLWDRLESPSYTVRSQPRPMGQAGKPVLHRQPTNGQAGKPVLHRQAQPG